MQVIKGNIYTNAIIVILVHCHSYEKHKWIFKPMNIDALYYLDKIRAIALALPGVTEAPCYGTPGFYASKKLIARLREEGDILVVRTDEREAWMKKDAQTFFITDHYKNYPSMLVALSRVTHEDLAELITTAWRNRVAKKLLKEWEMKNEEP